ncbi:DUF4148 domain-containing protein [Paraburkholderia sp. J63]|uniref:DUF4148 domain-containing protein n=1 Tax=Paraburkholderia sp. J63 TaxID=2805434 RepID=UPI002ABE7A6D|nr:DUF4148 domain-containing protein [Paraburkholderia sp. J63]
MDTLSRVATALVAAACCVASASAWAQPYNPSGPLTRAQVLADLAAWRAAGYDPLDWIHYPENAQRAAAIVAQRREASMMPQSTQ